MSFDCFYSSYSLLKRYNCEIYEDTRNTFQAFEKDRDLDNLKENNREFSPDDEQFEQDLLDKQAKLRAMRSKKAAENPLTFFDQNVPEWRLQDAFNSTTIRALFNFGDEIATIWTQFGENLNKFGRLVAAKVEVDIKTTMKVANFVTQNTKSTSDDVFEGLSDIAAPLFELPEAVDQVRKLNKTDTMNMIRAGINPLNTKPKLLSSLSATSTTDRVKILRKKRNEVKLPGLDAYRTTKTTPSLLKYDYEKKKRNSPSNAASGVMDQIMKVLPSSVAELQLARNLVGLPSVSVAASYDKDKKAIALPSLELNSNSDSKSKRKTEIDVDVDKNNNDNIKSNNKNSDITNKALVLIKSISENDRFLIARAGVEFKWALGRLLSCVSTADDDIADLRENRQMVMDLLQKYGNNGIETGAQESISSAGGVNNKDQVDTSALDRMIWRRVAERDELKSYASALEAACIASQSFTDKDDKDLDAGTVVLLLDGVLTLVNEKQWTWATASDKDRLSESQTMLSEVGNVLLRAKSIVNSWSLSSQVTSFDTDAELESNIDLDTSPTKPSSTSSSATEVPEMVVEDVNMNNDRTDMNSNNNHNHYNNVNMNMNMNVNMNVDDVIVVEMKNDDVAVDIVDVVDVDVDVDIDDIHMDIPLVTAKVVRFEEGVDLEAQVVYLDDSEGGEVSVVSVPNAETDSNDVTLSDAVMNMNEDGLTDTTVFVDTEASEMEPMEDQVVKVVLSSLDVAFFLIETFIQAVIPILSDGGQLAIKRTRQALWPEVEEGRWRLPYKLKTSKAFQQESQIGVKKRTQTQTKKDNNFMSQIEIQKEKENTNKKEDAKASFLPEETTVK